MIVVNGVASNKQYLGSQQAWFYKKGLDRSKPLTFKNIHDTDMEMLMISEQFETSGLKYSVDNGVTWNDFSWYDSGGHCEAGEIIYPGQTMMIKNFAPESSYAGKPTRIRSGYGTGNLVVSGNPLSLHHLNYEDVYTYEELEFHSMFQNLSSLTDASKLILDGDVVPNQCFTCMFEGCTHLVAPPTLPATTVSDYAYYGMFQSCSALVESPVIPDVQTLGYNAFLYMFNNCTSLSQITCLISADPYDRAVTDGWVTNVASDGTFIKNANNNYWHTGDDGIPSGWTVVNQ